MKVHVIAIGGSIMHSLAIQLHLLGYAITGSDDIIYDPARTRLSEYGLLPDKEGWFPEKISKDIDLIVLGKHAHSDNPELIRAQELGITVKSFPEFVHERSLDKKRIAVAGSHGKTTVTAMLMTLFKEANREFDYLVGAKLENFSRSFKLTASAPYIILEADEYPTSSLDSSPKFVHYRPQITIITGIAWDHMNAFPTESIYIDQFRAYLNTLKPDAKVIYNEEDEVLSKLISECGHIDPYPYNCLDYAVRNGKFFLVDDNKEWGLEVIGRHNMQNMTAVSKVADILQMDKAVFYESMSKFSTASKRLEKIVDQKDRLGFVDFAHAPSKVNASINAVKSAFPERKTIAVIELHTYSSLNKDFLSNYRDKTNDADTLLIYYSPKTLEIKRLPVLSAEIIREEMGRDDIEVFTSSDKLYEHLSEMDYNNTNLLMMSSGSFGKSDVRDWLVKLLA